MGGRASNSGFISATNIIPMSPQERKEKNFLPEKELKIAKALEKVLDSEYNTVKRNIKSNSLRGIRAYTGNDYKPINMALRRLALGKTDAKSFDEPLTLGRREKFDDLTIRDVVRKIDNVLHYADFKLSKDMTLVRYSSSQFAGLPKDATLEDFKQKFSDNPFFKSPSYSSASTRPNKQFGTVRYEITVPKGNSAGMYINSVSQFSNQYEFLFKRNSEFAVSDVSYANGEIVVKATWTEAKNTRIPSSRNRGRKK